MEDKKMKENYSNPMGNAIATVWDNLTDASIERAIDILPVIITWTAYSISLIICCALWVGLHIRTIISTLNNRNNRFNGRW